MPIYEYKCPKCKTKFELMRSFSQSNEAAVCDNCNGRAPRIVSNFASFSVGAGGVSAPIGGGGGCGGCSSTAGCDTCSG